MQVKKFLFICSENKLRSPTAEQIFSQYKNLEVRSAGLNNNAINVLTPEDIIWADYIFVMETSHRIKLQNKFKKLIKNQRVIVLNIPDKYDYMDINLVKELKMKVEHYC